MLLAALAIGGWEPNTIPFGRGGVPFEFGRDRHGHRGERVEILDHEHRLLVRRAKRVDERLEPLLDLAAQREARHIDEKLFLELTAPPAPETKAVSGRRR